MTHELVHVASGARYGDGQEVWLAEGLADLVGWSTVVPATAGARGRRRPAAGPGRGRARPTWPRCPTGATSPRPTPERSGDAYEGAWLATLLLEDELGVEGVLDLYEDASDGPGLRAPAAPTRALRAATGEGRAAFEARWTAYVASLAAR